MISRVAAAALVLLTSSAAAAVAQVPNGSNYRSMAVCDEAYIDGKWYSTFGEGRCPVGSRRPTGPRTPARNSTDPNQAAQNALDAQLAVLQGAQNALVGVAQQMAENQLAWSSQILSNFEFYLLDPRDQEPNYVEKTRILPLIGSTMLIRPGDVFLTQASGVDGDCIIANFSHVQRYSFGMGEHIVREGSIACRLREQDRAYAVLYPNSQATGGSNPVMYGWDLVRRRNGNVSLCIRQAGLNAACTPDRESAAVSTVRAFVTDRQTHVPMTLFEGLQDDMLTFTNVVGDEPPMIVAVDDAGRFVVNGHEFEVVSRSPEALVYRRVS